MPRVPILLVLFLLLGACAPAPAPRGPAAPAPAGAGPAGTPTAGGAPAASPSVPPPPVRAVITVLSASIDGHEADGSPWDPRDEASPAAGGPLRAWLAAHPELHETEAVVGEPVDAPGLLAAARQSAGADPVVLVEVGGRIYRSPIAPGQFQPTWRFPLVALLDRAPEATVRITVIDWDGLGQLDVIGETSVPAAELLARRHHELPRFGGVARLSLEVAPASPVPASRRVAVAGRSGWVVTEVWVVAGQEVTIRATGEVCSSGEDTRRCSGPAGQSRASKYNLAGFNETPHGALVAALGDTRLVVGRERRFVAASTGTLLLAANDRSTDDNRGSYEVAVDVR